MQALTPPSEHQRPLKHSLHYILSPTPTMNIKPDPSPPSHLVRRAPTNGYANGSGSASTSNSNSNSHSHSRSNSNSNVTSTGGAGRRRRTNLLSLPVDLLSRIAYYVVVDAETKVAGRPNLLLPLLLTSRSLNAALTYENNPALYNWLYRATFDYEALSRRTVLLFQHNVLMAGTPNQDIFAAPGPWAIDYKERWLLRQRMRAVVAHNETLVPGVTTEASSLKDMWAAWFMWWENDSKNMEFLLRECRFHEWHMITYRCQVLADSFKRGFPTDTTLKAIGCWLAIVSGTDLFGEQSAREIDEKVFLIRPYVFGCSHYNMFYAPWEYKHLPLKMDDPSRNRPNVTDPAMFFTRFGHDLYRAPPIFALCAVLMWCRIIDRHPKRVGLKQSNTDFIQAEDDPGLFSGTLILPSSYYDLEWQRATFCTDFATSAGMSFSLFVGSVQGYWRAHSCFYDYESYRQVLKGNVHALYTGTFSRHAIEVELRETIVWVRIEDVGGRGSSLSAGYSNHDGIDYDDEIDRIRRGYGHQVLTGEDVFRPDEPGWTKEMLLSGYAKTAWGLARVRGRLRTWDGLITLAFSNTDPHPTGEFTWRGYIHAGGVFVGRWRDTSTPADQYGYEGPTAAIRAGHPLYPEHMPKTMAESEGIRSITVQPTAGHAYRGMAPAGEHSTRPMRPSTATPVSPSDFSGSDEPMDGRFKRKASTTEPDGGPPSSGRRTSLSLSPRSDRRMATASVSPRILPRPDRHV